MESEDIRLLLSSCCSRELITAESLSLRPVAAHILIPGIDHCFPCSSSSSQLAHFIPPSSFQPCTPSEAGPAIN